MNDDVALEREADVLGNRAARGEIIGAAGALAEVPAGPLQRETSIVDDPLDPQNTAAKGTGRGLLKNSNGNILPARDCVFGPLLNECATSMEAWIDTNNYDLAGTEPKSGPGRSRRACKRLPCRKEMHRRSWRLEVPRYAA